MRAMQGGSLYHFYDGLLYIPAKTCTHDILRESNTDVVIHNRILENVIKHMLQLLLLMITLAIKSVNLNSDKSSSLIMQNMILFIVIYAMIEDIIFP